MTTFTKGQSVKSIAAWDNIATFVVRDAIIVSCGKKQMALADAHTGAPLGRNFKPQVEQYGSWVVVDCTMEEAKAIALVKADAYRVERLTYYRAKADDIHFARLADQFEATVASVVTPYEPGEQYGPAIGAAIEPRKPAAKKISYIARYEGEIVGTRKSHRTYTHAVVITSTAQAGHHSPHVNSWAGSLALAQREARKLLGYSMVASATVVPVEVA